MLRPTGLFCRKYVLAGETFAPSRLMLKLLEHWAHWHEPGSGAEAPNRVGGRHEVEALYVLIQVSVSE